MLRMLKGEDTEKTEMNIIVFTLRDSMVDIFSGAYIILEINYVLISF